jgi:hypothetical protein
LKIGFVQLGQYVAFLLQVPAGLRNGEGFSGISMAKSGTAIGTD